MIHCFCQPHLAALEAMLFTTILLQAGVEVHYGSSAQCSRGARIRRSEFATDWTGVMMVSECSYASTTRTRVQ